MFDKIPKKAITSMIVTVGIVFLVSYFIISKRNTMPFGADGFANSCKKEGFAPTIGGAYPRVGNSQHEGFTSVGNSQHEGFTSVNNGVYPRSGFSNLNEGFRASMGTGDLACGHALSDADKLLSIFSATDCQAEEKYQELRIILGKMACMKSDLMAPGNIVNSTRYLPYVTSHDREQVSETTARCFAKSIPQRDLDIIFDTWYSRAKTLINKLSVIVNLSEEDSQRAEQLLDSAKNDVYDVAKGKCIAGEPLIAGKRTSPRDPADYIPDTLAEHGEYKGYY
jgi:hypothetical protein